MPGQIFPHDSFQGGLFEDCKEVVDILRQCKVTLSLKYIFTAIKVINLDPSAILVHTIERFS